MTSAPDLVRPIPKASSARVRVQVFPLAADPLQLVHFCDRWFNRKIPAEISYVRPALPVVFATVLSYDEIALGYRWHSGVLAQQELYFLIVLECYRWQDGALRFVEYGATTPFIFVDSAESVAFGRGRFGFPKEVCEFVAGGTASPVPWAPYGTDLLTVKTWQPTPLGHQLAPLLTISESPRQPDPGFDRFTPLLSGRPNPGNRSDALWWMQSLWGELRARNQPHIAAATPQLIGGLTDQLANGLTISCYNLRQTPHPYWRKRTLYRDLVNFRIGVRGLQNLRLFQENFGPGARFTVSIKRRGIMPIVDRLGLRVARRQKYLSSDGEEVVDELEAILPIYTQADMTLGTTDRVGWQFEGRPWSVSGSADSISSEAPQTVPPTFDDHLGGSATLLFFETRESPPNDCKFMVLPARTEAVERYLAAYIPKTCGLGIRPTSVDGWTGVRLFWGCSRARTLNEIEGIAWLGGRYLSISIPVEYTYEGERQEALLLLYDFTDNPFRIQMSQAIFAGPTSQGWFLGAGGDWFASTQPVVQRQVLDTTMLRRSTNDAAFEVRQWLDVICDRRPESQGRPMPGESLAETFYRDIATIRPLLVFGGIPDSGSPYRWVERRCMRISYRLQWLHEPLPGSLDERHWVRVLPTEDYPLVSGLGLATDDVRFEVPAHRDFAPGPVDAVPVVALAEAAIHTRADNIEVLWSRRGLFPRTYRGAGLGVPFDEESP